MTNLLAKLTFPLGSFDLEEAAKAGAWTVLGGLSLIALVGFSLGSNSHWFF